MEKTFLNRCDDHGDVVAVDPFDIISDDVHLEEVLGTIADKVAALSEETAK